MAAKQHIDSLLKGKLTGHKQAPPGHVWEAIDAHLPLSPTPQNDWWKQGAVVVLLLTGLSIYLMLPDEGSGKIMTATANSSIEPWGNTIDGDAKAIKKTAVKESQLFATTHNPEKPVRNNMADSEIKKGSDNSDEMELDPVFALNQPVQKNNVNTAVNPISNLAESHKLENATEIHSPRMLVKKGETSNELPDEVNTTTYGPALLAINTTKANSIANQELNVSLESVPAFSFKDDSSSRKRPGVHSFNIGVTGSYSYTSFSEGSNIQSENTLYSLTSNYGFSYGLSAGYSFKNKFGIQIDWISNSTQKQTFQAYSNEAKVNGPYFSGTVTRKYTQIPLVVSYRQALPTRIFNRPLMLNYGAGIQYAVLKSALKNDPQHTIPADLQSNFKDDEFSLVAGIEAQAFLTRYLAFSLGIRGTIGGNINSGNVDAMDNWRNMVLGLRGSLNYVFGK